MITGMIYSVYLFKINVEKQRFLVSINIKFETFLKQRRDFSLMKKEETLFSTWILSLSSCLDQVGHILFSNILLTKKKRKLA